MGSITHTHQTAIANDPTKDVSANVWNAGHTFSLTKSDVGLGNVDNLSSATILASAATAAAVLYRPKLASNTTVNVPSQYATLTAALAYAATIDFSGFTLTIQLAAGTYSGKFIIPVTVGQALPGDLLIQGDLVTPTNVVLSGNLPQDGTILAPTGARCQVQGVQFASGSGPMGIFALGGGLVQLQTVDFGAGLYIHRYAQGTGQINAVGNYSISGSPTVCHLGADANGVISDFRTGGVLVTMTGTPAWGVAYAYARDGGRLQVYSTTFTGASTGARYFAQQGAGIDTQGGGANFLPGNSAGSVDATSYYA